jgi:HPt (histidine-containing phosphotransfer) domain-containing protein
MQDKNDNHPLDLSYLTEMVGHDTEFMIEVLETFVKQTPFYMAELEDALSAKDWSRVADYAHKIKPTFGYVGRADVKDFIQSIEFNSRTSINPEIVIQKIDELKILLDEIYHQIMTKIEKIKKKGI